MDADYIDELVRIGASPEGLKQAWAVADQALTDAGQPHFPKNACAATLSALLCMAGIDVKMTLGAGRLAERLGGSSGESRHWIRILIGEQKAGDVGVTFDEDGEIPGADHIYLVVERIDADEMIVADNQDGGKHRRYAKGRGKTPTEYFLRAQPRPLFDMTTVAGRSSKDDILAMAQAAPIARYAWNNRGGAPPAYIRGMALAYANAYTGLGEGQAFAVEMARAARSGDAQDVLTWYAAEFAALGMDNHSDGAACLRNTFVLLTGLAMRESSGRYCEGRDRSASNTTAETAEAGAFQSSYNLHLSHPLIDTAIATYSGSTELLDVFSAGVHAKASDLENFGEGAGREFQRLSKCCPAFAVVVAGIGVRHLRAHWGPINRRKVEIRPECETLFRMIEAYIEAGKHAHVH